MINNLFQKCGTKCFCGHFSPLYSFTQSRLQFVLPLCANTNMESECDEPSSSAFDQTLKTASSKFYQICKIPWAMDDSINGILISRFFPILILFMGILLPLTSGVLSSATVAFVYRGSSYQMSPLYALLWGIGQTVVAACVGFTRILATL